MLLVLPFLSLHEDFWLTAEWCDHLIASSEHLLEQIPLRIFTSDPAAGLRISPGAKPVADPSRAEAAPTPTIPWNVPEAWFGCSAAFALKIPTLKCKK